MPLDAEEALRRADLIRSDRSVPGVSRENTAEEGAVSWAYTSPKGDPMEDPELVKRWNALALPPAWTEVWICAHPRGHIQATGKDAKGRLQYRYHPDWIEITAEMKYDDVVYFASQLPRLRRQMDVDIEDASMSQETVSALVVKLMDLYNIRVGSDEYAKSNESYGLTTLKSMHLKHIRGDQAEGRHDAVFTFTGKSGKDWEITIEDDHLVDLIMRTNRLGAKDADLFMYVSEAGNDVDLKAEHINQYIKSTTGDSFTAKNFRTWGATSRCAERLAFLCQPRSARELKKWVKGLAGVESFTKLWSEGEWSVPDSETARNKVMLSVVDTVAADLGNTRSVCRSSYIHPWFMEAWMNGKLYDAWAEFSDMRRMNGMSAGESVTLRILKKLRADS
ncbi:MAG: hypothetical protein L7S02_03580 [Flavobacteriales bacterium]|nr:hypothetical protein [Flavobacteriales bacterium]